MDLDRLLILLKRPDTIGLVPFQQHLRGEFARDLCNDRQTRFVSLHVCEDIVKPDLTETGPGDPLFDALLEIVTSDSNASEQLLRKGPDMGTHHAYRVEMRRIKRYPRDWPDQERSPGIFMISPVYRAATLSAEEFDAHWREQHAPLARKHHVGMWDYRQSRVEAVLTPGSPRFDGIAHMGFRTLQDFREGLFDSDEGRRIIMDDTRKFLDLRRSEPAMMSEYILLS